MMGLNVLLLNLFLNLLPSDGKRFRNIFQNRNRHFYVTDRGLGSMKPLIPAGLPMHSLSLLI